MIKMSKDVEDFLLQVKCCFRAHMLCALCILCVCREFVFFIYY